VIVCVASPRGFVTACAVALLRVLRTCWRGVGENLSIMIDKSGEIEYFINRN
jgi:hypothetical protein